MWGNIGDYSKALEAFENSLRTKPDFTDALLGKGIMLSRLKRNDEAKQCANKILELKGTSEKPKDEKQQATQAQSLNESIRSQFNASQRKFSAKFAPPSTPDDAKRQ